MSDSAAHNMSLESDCALEAVRGEEVDESTCSTDFIFVVVPESADSAHHGDELFDDIPDCIVVFMSDSAAHNMSLESDCALEAVRGEDTILSSSIKNAD